MKNQRCKLWLLGVLAFSLQPSAFPAVVIPPPATTTYTRGLLRATNAAQGRSLLGLADTNANVLADVEATQFDTHTMTLLSILSGVRLTNVELRGPITSTNLTERLATKTDTNHAHAESDVTDLTSDLAVLTASKISTNATGVTLEGTFSGNGAGMTNIPFAGVNGVENLVTNYSPTITKQITLDFGLSEPPVISGQEAALVIYSPQLYATGTVVAAEVAASLTSASNYPSAGLSGVIPNALLPSLVMGLTNVATTYSVTTNRQFVICTTAGGGFNVYLPADAPDGWFVTVKRIGAGIPIVYPHAGGAIDGLTGRALTEADYMAVNFLKNGTNWWAY